jgi:dipeptidyl aminopeptidase/acylaminoacyl peptidase
MAVATWSDPHNPPDIVAFNLNDPQNIKRVTHVNSDVLDYLELGEVEELWYKSTDGTDIQGWIVKPPNFDASKKYPLVLRIHGGPHGMYNVAFNYNFQLHAAQDQVVLYTNPRGSTGYGYDFANAIQNAYPGNDYNDLMAGVDVLLEKGYIDEDKMYVYGGSGGGVLTSWIVGQTDRFAAASVNYPVTNWFSFVGTTDGAGWYYNFEKYPWEDPSEHIKRSPLMYVNKVKTPTMLMCGENDLRTPISQTEEYYQALKMNKVPTVMVRFNDEFHGTSSKPSNFLRTFAYLNAWFEKHPTRTVIRP